MTIETVIHNLSMYDVNEYGNAELHTWYKGIEEDMEESFKVAIETMRKYQKIQEIYLKWIRNYDITTSSAWTEVIEVLENGNDTTNTGSN